MPALRRHLHRYDDHPGRGDASQPAAGPAVQHAAEQSTDPQIRVFAIRALGELRHEPALPLLRSLVRDDTEWVRHVAISALGDFQRVEDVPLLLSSLQNAADAGVARQVLGRFALTPEQRRLVDAQGADRPTSAP